MNENVLGALQLFLQGMSGIFVVLGLIALIVYILNRMDR